MAAKVDRNRTKFMIKSLGWGRWKGIYEQELAKIRLNGEVPTLEIDTPAEEPAPTDKRTDAPIESAIATRGVLSCGWDSRDR